MQRMRGSDAYHLYLETRTEHRHTIKVVVVDPTTAREPSDIATARHELEHGLAYVPPFQWQLVHMPFEVCHPLWAYRRKLDLDYHVRRAAVVAPGGAREFAEVVSEIASTGLERDRPLWQLWIVEGLAGGRIAYVVKVHHALADGQSSARILMDSLQPSPEESPPQGEHPFESDEPIPPPSQIFLDGVRDSLHIGLTVPKLLARLIWVGLVVLGRRLRRAPRSTLLFKAPNTRFNRKLTPHRWFATVELPLADLKRVKDLLGGSLNDVYITVCGGAIRRYLEARGELPSKPMVAAVPVSTRKPEEERAYGNRVSSWMINLATDRVDPLERYQAVRASTAAARDIFEAGDRDMIPDLMEAWWLYRFLVAMSQGLMTRITGRPAMHAIVSNVRGPSAPLYLNGARLLELQSMGPLIDGVGLNFTGWSYVDKLSVGIVACREHVPDIWDLAKGVTAELKELLEAAEKVSAR
ncbi:MAG: wax ester/triacylglycerol synthase family O-acyltransferase [Deltaproteobacteria bacterium]|nr:wax ester/triacylglycerol synthase family O-acyltransferase [Deltaproteobacteria bacterium]MBW2417778.1 wax ester/triacylglycerol synthase family O-acyltransferase [Deltaproteobacteria bacterium]